MHRDGIIKARIERIAATFISRTRHKSPSGGSAFIKVICRDIFTNIFVEQSFALNIKE